jgi:hypothetical protein
MARMIASQCCATDQEFDPRVARRDLRRFRRRGPNRATLQLVAAVQDAPLSPQPTLLDIGGGVGAIHHLLLDSGFARAVQIDASAAYLSVAAAEAQRLGHTDRVTFQHADFQAVAADVPPAEVVTLDRVVCCNPDFTGMLGAAADHARRLVGFTYPRPRWLARVIVAIANGWRRLWGHSFRVYVHSPTAMTAVLERRGMRRRWVGGTWIWAAELFERPGAY